MNILTRYSRSLRKKQTPHEEILWRLLRSRRFKHLKFRRQYPISMYITDFCCFEKKLVIELDGGGHNEPNQILKDNIRDYYLRRQGYKVIRFWNNEVTDNISGVLEKIAQEVDP